MELRDMLSGSSPVRISPDATVSDALVSMIENKTDFLLIDRRSQNDSYGIISRWDIVEGAIANGRDLATSPVTDFARKPLVVMNNLNLDIRWVAKKMANERVSKIAVFNADEFLGFITDVDILKVIAARAKQIKEAKE
ncbi:MAG: CBS domain-containing protein [Thermoplasmatota archaeon]|nr:CBS domain-containing protein [Candidatus Thermoplasmatota archaeon]MBU1915233.1 CBS domain-containing protein [Candidatus Thermoplasmatota archaeon]